MTAAVRPTIAHVSCAHPWTDNRIHYREAATLVDAGYPVWLIALESTTTGDDVGVRVIRHRPLPRALRVLVGPIRATVAALRTGARVVHLHDPELAVMVPLLRVLGRRVIYDAHEDLPVQVRSKEYLPGWARLPMVAAAHLLLTFARASNHVVAATETIAMRFPSERCTVVQNFPPLRAQEQDAVPVSQREASAVYVGGIGLGRGAVQMVEAAGRQEFPAGWRVDLAGSTTPTVLERLGTTPGWERVVHHGVLPSPEARDLVLHARVGLVLLRDSQAYRDSLPTKMFEYFAAGVPVIASDFPAWRPLVVEGDCGLLVDQTSPSAIAQAIARYAADPALLRRHSENARRLAVERYHWGAVAPALLAAYRRVLHA